VSEALQWYRSSRGVALRAGMDFQAAEADLNIAEILIHQERLDEAEDVLRGAVRVLRASGMPLVALFGDLLLARLVLRRGDLEEADRTAAHVVEQSTDLGSPLNAAEALLVRAQVALERDDAVAALALVDAADRGAGEEVVAVAAQMQLVRGGALLRLGRREEALVSIDAGLESARAQELLYEEARLLEVRAALVDGTADAARAHALLAEMGVRV
jgi:tetratricopeptide (TPR) repeat protein